MEPAVAKRAIGTLVVSVLFVMIAYAAVFAVQEWQHTHTPGHGSPSDVGIFVRSTLRDANGIGDSKNCVGKTTVGPYRAASLFFDNGQIHDVVYADTFGEVNCHFNNRNGAAHQGVRIFPDGDRDYGPKKSHTRG